MRIYECVGEVGEVSGREVISSVGSEGSPLFDGTWQLLLTRS